jgi:thiol-disulfide isomerase/thioredoxin
MTSAARQSFTRSGLFITFAMLVLLATIAGCQQTSTEAVPEAKTAGKSADAATLLKQMTAAYRDATSYEDAGELHLSIAESGEQPQETQPLPFSVALDRPNKIRAQSLQGTVVANGEKLIAYIDPLEGQMLSLPCPEKLTVENVIPDRMLAEAMRGQLNVQLQQLPLLLAAEPLKELAEGDKPIALEDAEFRGETCQRVAVRGSQGTTVFWISPENHLLRKIEFPTDAMKQKFSLSSCSLWAEFNGARANTPIAAEAFTVNIPDGTKLLKRFLAPPPTAPSSLLAQVPADFVFINLQGEPVNRESLKDKIVVLDMWATWCSWCFEGFPNLEKVYQQYKDNDRIVILAVSRDEPSVSDEQLRQAFQKANLSIPIVRDQEQLTGKVFQVEGLPTMVILGADGTVQDYHIGYDANLANTLPKKLDRLLAGESLAKDELDKYEEERKAYEEQLSDALANDAESVATDSANVAQKDSSTE